MKISLAWLNSYLDRSVTADEAADILHNHGFPVEDRESIGDDVCLDVEVTSNRSDALSHFGMAREVAAGSDRNLKPIDINLIANGPAADSLTNVANDAPDLCNVYTARVIRGVKVGESPAWLRERLEAIGLRSVNNVVDVTNFVLMELGQPLHAFDMNLLDENRIVVRRATQGEPFTAIDGTQHKLADDMLVIADASKPVAVAGVMGGLHSEVGDQTTDVLLESAQFNPLSVRSTSRTLKLASDSSYRFERGVDPEGVDRASLRAAQLILELAGGALAEGVIREGAEPPAHRRIELRPSRCAQLLGIDLPPQQQVDYLAALDLNPSLDGDAITCIIPGFRLDLNREVDLIEEIARLHGLDNIPTSRKIHIEARSMQQSVAARRLIGQVLTAHGYHETITFSFVSEKQGKLFLREGESPLMVDDERRKAEPMLRPSLLPSLMVCRKSNQDVGNAHVKLYESASCWAREGETIVERRQLALLADSEDAQHAMRELRGTVHELIERLSGQQAIFEPADDASVSVTAGGKPLGFVRVIDKRTQDLFDLQTPVVAAALDADALIGLYPPQRTVGDLARFPGIERDVSAIVDESVTWATIESEARATEPALLESLDFVTAYRGKQIGKGRKSVTLRMIFRDPDRTLRHEQVDPQVDAVMKRLTENVGAEIRQ